VFAIAQALETKLMAIFLTLLW